MMDMNGDGFPDIIAGGTIQYTNSQGGLSGEIYKGIGANNSDNASEAWGYGGNPVASVSDITKLISGSKSSAQNQQSSWLAQFSISGSAPKNTDEAVESFIDINGDGLPDKILSYKKVRLNLGYAFTEPIDWELDRIQSGKSLSYNLGVGTGINKASGSFSAGFGIVTSENEEEYNLIDINSDGLPDKVWKNGNGITVALNTGNGFDEPISWKGANALSESASTAESVNAAFTVTFNLLTVKISTNPGASTSHSINRPTYSLQDVDGDGYLDIVESEKESELKVTRSAIGRTNMLKSVTNSLGGTFTLDYAHTTPTYGLPGGKWVMSALTIDDGIHDDGPVMTTAFEYKDGKRDRHEREFLGFGEVITKNLDTEKGNSVYRQAVENYDVANYYTQGNVTATSVEDANGNKYTETKNRYDSYYMTADGDKYTFAKRVQYTHARIRSILRKAEEAGIDFRTQDEAAALLPEEIELIKALTEYPATVQAAAANFAPSIVGAYAYELAKSFNGYYHDHSILKEECTTTRDMRLRLAEQVARTIRLAMALLGIDVPERM